MRLRPLTLEESVELCRLSVVISRAVDGELGRLLARVAGGDDSVMPDFHTRLNVCGRPELADRLRDLVCGRR